MNKLLISAIVGVLILVAIVAGIYHLLKINSVKSTLGEFIEENLYEKNWPGTLEVKKIEDLYDQGSAFMANWKVDDIDFNAASICNNCKVPELMMTASIFKDIGGLDESRAPDIARVIFKVVQGSWRCGIQGMVNVCETFWTDQEKKSCLSVENIIDTDKYFLNFYKIPSESDNYSQQGCRLVR